MNALFRHKFYECLFLLLLPLTAHAEEIPQRTREFGMPPHEHYDHLLREIFIDLTVIGVVFSLVALYFMFTYKRKSPGDVGQQPKLSAQSMLGWVLIPATLFLGEDLFLFVRAWDLHDDYRKVPANAYEIKLTGSLWSWTYEYPNGVSSVNELVVPVGKPVLLRMTSTDVVHSHYMNKYRVTEDVMPGRITYEWFMPNELGESVATCREYCGMLHSGMHGKIKVVTQDEFDTWLAAKTAGAAPQGSASTKMIASLDATVADAHLHSTGSANHGTAENH